MSLMSVSQYADSAKAGSGPCLFSILKGLVSNYREGGLQNGRGGHMKFYPYEKGGVKSFSHAEVGGTTSFGAVLTR